MKDFKWALEDAAAKSGLPLAPRIVAGCAAHFALLVRWNRVHNLTRITEPLEAARTHYLDCLVPLLAGEAPRSFVDVGAGAGFPGLLAALVWPSSVATLVEPSQKRSSFLRLAAAAMDVHVEVGPPGRGRGVRVLSRATFPPGSRAPLAAYADPAVSASVSIWGHPHDAATWSSEVVTWAAGWSAVVQPYVIDSVEARCLLRAERGALG